MQILQALSDAARRGVDVKIILPGMTDSGLVHHATQSFYSEMLTGGIKIYLRQIAVLHAKTAVIDKVWPTIGSTNIDTRSFLHNNEINVAVFGEEFANAMENAFIDDLRYSIEITKEKWEQRALGDRLKEWIARRLKLAVMRRFPGYSKPGVKRDRCSLWCELNYAHATSFYAASFYVPGATHDCIASTWYRFILLPSPT